MQEMAVYKLYGEFLLRLDWIAFPASLKRLSAWGVLETSFQCEEAP